MLFTVNIVSTPAFDPGIIDDSESTEVQVSAVVLANHERVATGCRGEGNAVQVHDLVKLARRVRWRGRRWPSRFRSLGPPIRECSFFRRVTCEVLWSKILFVFILVLGFGYGTTVSVRSLPSPPV